MSKHRDDKNGTNRRYNSHDISGVNDNTNKFDDDDDDDGQS